MTDANEEERPWEVRKTFMEHLLELRSRIFICLFFVLAATIAAWVFWKHLGVLIIGPLEDYNASAPEEAKADLIITAPMEAFTAVLQLGLWAGLVLASPVVLWETWRFVAPGLYRRERFALLPLLFFGPVLFAAGAWFAYTYVLPIGLAYLLSFAPELRAEAKLSLRQYMQFFLMIIVAFGLAFETPLMILGLARLGLVTARGLLRSMRYVIVAAFIVGAILTPPDVLTQGMMAGCLIVLYVVSIILAWIFGRRPAVAEEPETDPAEDP